MRRKGYSQTLRENSLTTGKQVHPETHLKRVRVDIPGDYLILDREKFLASSINLNNVRDIYPELIDLQGKILSFEAYFQNRIDELSRQIKLYEAHIYMSLHAKSIREARKVYTRLKEGDALTPLDISATEQKKPIKEAMIKKVIEANSTLNGKLEFYEDGTLKAKTEGWYGDLAEAKKNQTLLKNFLQDIKSRLFYCSDLFKYLNKTDYA